MDDATLVTVAGRDPERQHGVVNPPVYHASTILFPTVAAMEAARPRHGITYGRYGTPTTFALEEAIAQLEGGDRAIVVGSGKTAITSTAAGAAAAPATTCWWPTRSTRRPAISAPARSPASASRPPSTTRARRRHRRADPPRDPARVHREPRLAHLRDAGHAGHRRGRPRARLPGRHGQHLGLAAFLQAVRARRRHLGPGGDQVYRRPLRPDDGRRHLDRGRPTTGCGAACSRSPPPPAPDDCYLALRGLRTLAARLERHQRSALVVAEWLRTRPEVREVLYPALPERSRPRALEARFPRRFRAFRHHPRALREGSGRRHARPSGAVRHGLELGRLREPADPDPPRDLPHRHALGRAEACRCASMSGSRTRAT